MRYASATTMRPNFVVQMRKGTLPFCVLALVAARPSYARALARDLRREAGMSIPYGTIYPLLARLEEEALVASTTTPSPRGPARRYYEITPRGLHALREFTEQWHSFAGGVELLVKGLDLGP